MVHPASKLMLVWRGIAGLLALGFTAIALDLLVVSVTDRATALLFAAAAGVAAIPCWWFALRGLARVQRLIIGFLAILFTGYAVPVVWSRFAHRSAGGLILGAVIAIIAIPCWRFARSILFVMNPQN
jgi:hypothetical protein